MRLGALVSVAAVLLVACAGKDVTSPRVAGGAWALDHEEEDAVLLSVWGSGPNDVWVAGGQVGRGLVLHGDGAGWTPVETGADELLWWIYGFGPADVYAVGERGLILHYDGQRWARALSGTESTLYGVWGASAEDVWIVGGDVNDPEGTAVVLRGRGQDFRPAGDLPASMSTNVLFKVYGYAPGDVIAVGSRGTVLRWDGQAWRRELVPTREPLFSLWGRGPSDLYAVGGYGAGEVLHFDGGGWSRASESPFAFGLSGVFTAPDEPVIAVGVSAYVLEISPLGTEVEPELPAMRPGTSLHGVWGDGEGTTYAVGGDLAAYPAPMRGVIVGRE